MADKKTVLCPICKRKVGIYDGRGTINLAFRCKKCQKQVIYKPMNGERLVKPIPEHPTSGSAIFS